VLDRVERALARAGALPVPAAGASSGPFEDAEFEALVAEFAVELPAYLASRPGEHPRSWPELLAFNRADELELSRFGDDIFGLCPAALAAGGTDSATYRAARQACDQAAGQALAQVLGDCEFAIAPTNSPAWPIEYGTPDDYRVLTSSLCAVTGSPSISLPAGQFEGLPIGVSVLGRHGQDERVLAFAAALEPLLPAPRYPFG
nr:amidase family protein [Actinomycetota bacterium]